MAAELEKLSKYYEEKGNLPRAALYASLAQIERAEGGPETLPKEAETPHEQLPPLVLKPEIYLPTPEELVTSERKTLKRFFGKDITVATPPEELLEILETLAAREIKGFEAHFLPGMTLNKGGRFPGWKVKPEKWFWDRVKDGSIRKSATTLQEGWYLVDRRGKPNYNNGQQRYEDDALIQAVVDDLRAAKQIEAPNYVPSDSRFGASPDEIEQIILPELARQLETKGTIRNKKYIEFNVWGNMLHPEWGQTNTWEWFADKYEGDLQLVGGHSDCGGLAGVDHGSPGRHIGNTAFSPLIAFPSRPR